MEENKKIIKSIFSSESKIEKEKQYSIVDELKKVYHKYFKHHYNLKKSKVGPLFRPIFQQTSNYNQRLKEQSNFEEYIQTRHLYFERNSNHRLSIDFRKDMIKLIRLENSNKEECIEYLIKRFNEKFNNDKYVSEYNLRDSIKEFYELWLKEDQTNLQKEEEAKSSNYSRYNDDSSSSGGYSDGGSDDNRYQTSYNNRTYNSNSSSSSKSNNNYNNNYKNNFSKNVSNKKKKVKVIMCYSCKGKNKYPLCGDKMNSKVSLGNLYAHFDCYNEGTCCLCNKRGNGNQVQSICSDCRKNGNGKGLSGSAKCFVCRRLIN